MARGRPDFSPTAVDVVLRPEWAVVEGIDKSLVADTSNADFEDTAVVGYTVAAGKAFYVHTLVASCMPMHEEDGDNNQFCRIEASMGVILNIVLGGNGGCLLPLVPPLKGVEGETFKATVRSLANHLTHIHIFAYGYEVPV